MEPQHYDPRYAPRTGDRIALFWHGPDLSDTPQSWEIRGRVVDVDPEGRLFRVKGREETTRTRVDKWFQFDSDVNESGLFRQATHVRRRGINLRHK